MSSHYHHNPSRVLEARTAILSRFRALNTASDGIANIHMFNTELAHYAGGYFQTALHGLITEDCIEMLSGGRFIRLLERGHKEVHSF